MKKVFLLFSVLVGILIVVSSCAAGVAQEDLTGKTEGGVNFIIRKE